MSETLMDIMAAEQAAQTTEAKPSSDPPSSDPQLAAATPPLPETPPTPAETPPPQPSEPATETPTIDPFIKEASEVTGMDLSNLKDKQALFQSYAEARRKISQGDDFAKFGRAIAEHPNRDQIVAILEGKFQQPEPKQPEPPKQTATSVPEWDSTWETIVQAENPPPEILAKYNRRRAWEKQRAEALISSESLHELIADPEGFIRKLVEPVVSPIKETQEQAARRLEQERIGASVKAVLAPVEKQIFTGNWGDWEAVTPFGAKVRDRYTARPEYAQTDPVKWLDDCIQYERALMPKPNATLPVPATAERAPNAGPPPLDPDAVEKAVDEAIAKNPNMSVVEIEAIYKKLKGQVPQ